MADERMNVQEQVRLILDIANILRGPFKEDEYQKVIIPMTICRRFECMLEETRDVVYKDVLAGRDNDIRLKKKSGYPIYNKSNLTIEKIIADPGKAHENFVLYLNSFNSLGVDIFNNLDFFKYVDLLADRKKLVQVLKRFANTDLSLKKVSSMQMGYVMEEIIRTYSENASAGDHFTPREVIKCLTRLLLAEGCEDLKVPGKIVTLADYACGTGGMLYEGLDEIKLLNETAEVELFGQDNNPWYSSIALAETIIRGQNPENIRLVENSLTEDAHSDQKMRLILMNPPFGQAWSKDKIGEEQYKKIISENTRSGGKYSAGLPQSGDMQMLFWELIISKLENDSKNNNYGRAAVICNGAPLFSGGAKSGESNIRKWLFEHDYVEAIIQFCPELFYNTGISIYAFIFNMKKRNSRKGKIQLINASSFSKRLTKGLGFKRNELTNDHINEIVRLYTEFDKPENAELVKIFNKKDFYYKEVPCYRPFQRNFMITADRIDNVLDIQSYKKLYDEDDYLSLEDLPTKTQAQLDKMASYKNGKELQSYIISRLTDNISEKTYYNREEFTSHVEKILDKVANNKTLIKGIVLSLSDFDKRGEKYYNKKGVVETDNDLKEIEIIPYNMDNNEFFKREVKPFVDDGFLEIDDSEISIGCEINFTKYFYVPIEHEKSSLILSRINESKISGVKVPKFNKTKTKLKYVTKSITSGGTPTSDDSRNYTEENGINWVAIGDMSTSSYVDSTQKQITKRGQKEKRLKIYPPGTLLYSIYATIGKVSILKIPAAINQAILAIVPDEGKITNDYLKYSLIALEDNVLEDVSTNTQANLNAEKVKNFKLSICNIEEQKIITQFLDEKVSEIDDRIAKLNDEINELKKYKKSLIYESVIE